MPFLLDTQVLVLAYLGESLPKRVLRLLNDPETELLISSVSIIEISIKRNKGMLAISPEQTREAILDLRGEVLPFKEEHAYQLYSLPLHHKDPFDRMILATALAEGLPLLSGDACFKRYRGLRLIW